eukprot:1192722-Prorocentrum_minimum.AAC.1
MKFLVCLGVFLLTATLVVASDVVPYFPCYPAPTEETVNVNGSLVLVNITACGNVELGNQSLWWRAVEPDHQCFGMSRPDRRCSKSTTNEFQCLVGPKWDELRVSVNYPEEQRKQLARVEVELVARTGTFSAYERVSRSENYLTLEAWKSSSYRLADKYYIWGDVHRRPFVKTDKGIAYATNSSVLLAPQPRDKALEKIILEIEEFPILGNLLGATGLAGIFVNGPGDCGFKDRRIDLSFKFVLTGNLNRQPPCLPEELSVSTALLAPIQAVLSKHSSIVSAKCLAVDGCTLLSYNATLPTPPWFLARGANTKRLLFASTHIFQPSRTTALLLLSSGVVCGARRLYNYSQQMGPSDARTG